MNDDKAERKPTKADEPEAEQPTKRVRTLAVTLVERRAKTVIVEYESSGRRLRCMLPSDAFSERIAVDVLAAGVSMSVPWADLLEPSVTGAQLEEVLRNNGIWTKADWRTKQREVMSALQVLTSDVLMQMHKAMNEYGGE